MTVLTEGYLLVDPKSNFNFLHYLLRSLELDLLDQVMHFGYSQLGIGLIRNR